jgi:hypothetical protein
MNAQVLPVYVRGGNERRSGPESRLPWPYAIACCLYFIFIYRALTLATPTFAKMFTELGIVIPLPTLLLIASYRWVYSITFVGAVILTIVKQFVVLRGASLRVANLLIIFVGIVFAPLATLLLYWPLLELTWKLKSMR